MQKAAKFFINHTLIKKQKIFTGKKRKTRFYAPSHPISFIIPWRILIKIHIFLKKRILKIYIYHKKNKREWLWDVFAILYLSNSPVKEVYHNSQLK